MLRIRQDNYTNQTAIKIDESVTGTTYIGKAPLGSSAAVAPAAELELNLYSAALGTPVQEQQYVLDPNQVLGTGVRGIQVSITEETLAAGDSYAVTARPTSASTVSCYEIAVNAAAHLAFWPGGTSVYKCTRSDDTGVFTTDTAARILMGIQVTHIDDGTGPGTTGGGSYTFVS